MPDPTTNRKVSITVPGFGEIKLLQTSDMDGILRWMESTTDTFTAILDGGKPISIPYLEAVCTAAEARGVSHVKVAWRLDHETEVKGYFDVSPGPQGNCARHVVEAFVGVMQRRGAVLRREFPLADQIWTWVSVSPPKVKKVTVVIGGEDA